MDCSQSEAGDVDDYYKARDKPHNVHKTSYKCSFHKQLEVNTPLEWDYCWCFNTDRFDDENSFTAGLTEQNPSDERCSRTGRYSFKHVAITTLHGYGVEDNYWQKNIKLVI